MHERDIAIIRLVQELEDSKDFASVTRNQLNALQEGFLILLVAGFIASCCLGLAGVILLVHHFWVCPPNVWSALVWIWESPLSLAVFFLMGMLVRRYMNKKCEAMF